MRTVTGNELTRSSDSIVGLGTHLESRPWVGPSVSFVSGERRLHIRWQGPNLHCRSSIEHERGDSHRSRYYADRFGTAKTLHASNSWLPLAFQHVTRPSYGFRSIAALTSFASVFWRCSEAAPVGQPSRSAPSRWVVHRGIVVAELSPDSDGSALPLAKFRYGPAAPDGPGRHLPRAKLSSACVISLRLRIIL